MTEERDWRASKAPKWVIEAAEAEMLQWKLTAALSWPTEPKPAPVPFQWGEYDRLVGDPVPGVYWTPRTTYGGSAYAERVEFRRRLPGEADPMRNDWLFLSSDGKKWTSSITRGPLYATERDALLSALWSACEDAARRLMAIRDRMS